MMAIRSGFFNSVNGDRKYDARRFAEYFATFISNGVFPNPSTNLQVMANNDMTVTVKVGKAWINGYILINDDDYILQLEPADGVLNRIDRIVARYDVVDREIRLEIKKGTFASTPVAPALQRDADAYELALADIYVAAGTVSITQANITDLRLNTDLCGIVHGTVEQVDTTTLFNQYLSWLQEKKNQYDQDMLAWTAQKKSEFESWAEAQEQGFETWRAQEEQSFYGWFEHLQDILDENVAGNLLNLINANSAAIAAQADDLDSHLADFASQDVGKGADMIGLPDPNGLFTATTVRGALEELFTFANDGKTLIANAITAKGVPADPTETFTSLAAKIGQISTGKKWASGTYNVPKDGATITESLEFHPTIVIVYNLTAGFGSQRGIWIEGNSQDRNGRIMHWNSAGNSQGDTWSTITVTDNVITFTYSNNYLSDGVSWIAFE